MSAQELQVFSDMMPLARAGVFIFLGMMAGSGMVAILSLVNPKRWGKW